MTTASTDGVRRWATPASAGWLLLLAAGSAPAAAVLFLGLSNRFLADDFSVAVSVENLGFFGAWRDQLSVLNGRFAGYLFVDFLALLGPHLAPIATAVGLAALLGGVALAVPDAGDLGRRAVIVVVLVGAIVLSAPSMDQTFLWISGIGMATASVVLGLVAGGLAWRSLRAATPGQRRAMLFGAAAMAFFACGAYETATFVIVPFAVGAVIAGPTASARLAASAVVGGGVLGFAAVALIPGSRARQQHFPDRDPFDVAVRIGVGDVVPFVQDVVWSEPGLLAVLAGLLLVAPAVAWRTRLWWSVCTVAACAGAIAASLAFSQWALGFPALGRTQLLPAAGAIVATAALGWLIPLPPRLVPVGAAFAAFVAVPSAMPLADRAPVRRDWAAAWDRRDAVLERARGQGEAVIVEPLPDNEGGLEEVGTDPRAWVNQAVAQYYDVPEVVAGKPDSAS